MHSLKADIQRFLYSMSFIISILLAFILLFRPLLTNWITWGFRGIAADAMTLLSEPLALSSFTPFAVLFCALPYSISFCEDYNSGYMRTIIVRIGKFRYIANRIISVMFSGTLAMGIPIATIILLCVIGATQPITQDTLDWLPRNWIPYTQHMSGLWMFILKILLAMLFGAVWSLMALFISTLIPNRYVTLIAPFVIYQAMWALLPESQWNPLYQLRADFEGLPSIWFSFTYQICLTCILVFASALGMRRRILK